ncbi:MAG: hypothetical protein DRM97_03665 [Thermoprotei archaeon]|nr:MAG: hypothetical protein DRM97_03665 [Thermoprotei archaeon]
MSLARYILVASKDDPASVNMFKTLLNTYPFKEHQTSIGDKAYRWGPMTLIIFSRELLELDNIDQELGMLGENHYYVFLSRHESEAKIPSLLVHTPGNWTSHSPYGGKPYEICICPSLLMKKVLLKISRNIRELSEKWRFGMEVTHHGPYLQSPAIFIEIGSTEEEWTDKQASNVLIHSLVDVLMEYNHDLGVQYPFIIGIGGPHYAPSFNRIALETDVAVSHVIPSYALEADFRYEMIIKAIRRSLGRFASIVLDWKGLRAHHREKILNFLGERSIKTMKVKELLR